VKKIVVPTLNRSFLYQRVLVQLGTIGTIEKLMLITNLYLSNLRINVDYQPLFKQLFKKLAIPTI